MVGRWPRDLPVGCWPRDLPVGRRPRDLPVECWPAAGDCGHAITPTLTFDLPKKWRGQRSYMHGRREGLRMRLIQSSFNTASVLLCLACQNRHNIYKCTCTLNSYYMGIVSSYKESCNNKPLYGYMLPNLSPSPNLYKVQCLQ